MFPSLILLRSRDTIFLHLKTGDKSSQHKHGLNFLPLAPVSCCPRVLLQCVKLIIALFICVLLLCRYSLLGTSPYRTTFLTLLGD